MIIQDGAPNQKTQEILTEAGVLAQIGETVRLPVVAVLARLAVPAAVHVVVPAVGAGAANVSFHLGWTGWLSTAVRG